MESLARIRTSRKTGAEPFTATGQRVGPTVADFWGWSRSDLLDNTERGVLAEFIVAAALGISTDGVREGWAAWDLTTPDGVRVEVKSAAFLQSWAQKARSRISFSTPRTLAWDADGLRKIYGSGDRQFSLVVRTGGVPEPIWASARCELAACAVTKQPALTPYRCCRS